MLAGFPNPQQIAKSSPAQHSAAASAPVADAECQTQSEQQIPDGERHNQSEHKAPLIACLTSIPIAIARANLQQTPGVGLDNKAATSECRRCAIGDSCLSAANLTIAICDVIFAPAPTSQDQIIPAAIIVMHRSLNDMVAATQMPPVRPHKHRTRTYAQLGQQAELAHLVI